MINRIRKQFTQIPNELINDREIDRGARFLFVYLCTKPESWKYFTRDIQKALVCSKDTRLKYMKELTDRGWITTDQKRTASGSWGPTDIVLHATPQTKKPATVRETKKAAAENNGGGETSLHSKTNSLSNNNLFSDNREGASVKKISEEILAYLNEKKPSTVPFKNTPTNRAKIEARLKETYSAEDLKKVIDLKVSEWKDKAKTRKWIRPETLFGTKFNGYLIAALDNQGDSKTGGDNFKLEPTDKPIFSE